MNATEYAEQAMKAATDFCKENGLDRPSNICANVAARLSMMVWQRDLRIRNLKLQLEDVERERDAALEKADEWRTAQRITEEELEAERMEHSQFGMRR